MPNQPTSPTLLTPSTLTIHCGNCVDVLSSMEADSVDLCFADPPYNIGIFKKMPEGEYLTWCEEWIRAVARVLKANGAFWVSHKNPEILVEVSRMVAKTGYRRINWVTWDKYSDAGELQGFMDGYTIVNNLRSFQVMAEYLVYHADDGLWDCACGKLWSGEFEQRRGFIFEPLRAYLDGEKQRAGFTTRQVAEAFQRKTGSRTVTGMAGHWFTNVQWVLPTAENYQWLCSLFNQDSNEYLRKDYEELRKEYEHLRYTFNNPGKVSSVWQIPPASRSWHPTPKPLALLERIIEATSNPGDLVLDPFFGSGTTGKAALKLGRRCVGIDTNAEYCERAREDIEKMLAQPRLL